MAKKGQTAQLQIEVTNDEEWEKLLEKPGLIVVDVYNEWAGPCAAMMANLKKIKMEIGGDNLVLAIAKAEGITCLKRFVGRSQPTWLFAANKKLVNIMFGANVPRLMSMITEELKRELAAQKGERDRVCKEFTELSEDESRRHEKEVAEKLAVAKDKEVKEYMRIHNWKVECANAILENQRSIGLILVFPHCKKTAKDVLGEFWDAAKLSISNTERPQVTQEMLDELKYFVTELQFTELDTAELLSAPSIAYLVRCSDDDVDIDEVMLKFVYGDMREPPGSPDSPADRLINHVELTPQIERRFTKQGPPSLEDLREPSAVDITAIDILNGDDLQQPPFDEPQAELEEPLPVQEEPKPPSESRRSHERPSLTPQKEESEVSVRTVEIAGLWTPPDAYTRATAIKLFFPKFWEAVAVEEPEPTPPHVAIAFDTLRRKEILELGDTYPNAIMRYGYFTTANPYNTELVANNERALAKHERIGTEKLVIQLSRKRSEALCAFANLSPVHISHNLEEGEKECKLFFPEGYDDLMMVEEEEPEEEVKDKRKKKKRVTLTEEDEEVEEPPPPEAAEMEGGEDLGVEEEVLEEGGEEEQVEGAQAEAEAEEVLQ